MAAVLEQFGAELWLLEGDPLRMLGIPFGTRMTIARFDDGGLWLHSPVVLTEDRVAAVTALGPVRHIVAPCTFHHLYVDPWCERFPDAAVWCAPGLPARYPDRDLGVELSDDAPAAWAGQIEQVVVGGNPILLEVVFFHRRSGALIITDIVQNHEPDADGWFFRNAKWLNGISAPNGGVPRDWRYTVRDKALVRRCRDRMLAWPFDRVVLGHGTNFTDDAHSRIERAFAWL